MWQKKLKKLRTDLITSKPSRPKSAPPQQAEDTPDISFSDYCQQLNIKPLTHDQVYQPAAPKVAPISRSHSLANSSPSFDFFDEQSSGPAEFFRHGQRILPQQLRQGKFPIYASLDLHSYSKGHALLLLERFLEQAPAKAVVKIIHGYGTNSVANQPILLRMVRRYLSEHPRVLAFSYADNKNGGAGATLVKLST